MSELLSVSEFARRAGVSRQAIQQRLDTSLREFVKVEQGKKWLDSNGLRLFVGTSLAQEADNEKQASDAVDRALIELLQAQMETLREQLHIKDQQIQEQARQISELSDRLREGHALLDQQQRLHAAQLLQAPEPEPEPNDGDSPTEDLTDKTPPRRSEPEPGKKSWLRRIFAR